MSGQPEALRLADQLVDPVNAKLYLAPYVAAELRRQHALIQEMRAVLIDCLDDAEESLAEMLESRTDRHVIQFQRDLIAKARAALAKSEERQ